MGYKFTVFTPTYNRAGTLPMVYSSLKNQTLKDFQWVLVDDGSTDNTQEVISGFQKDADFDIRVLTQKNSGKHVAQNRAVDLAEGELFLPLDSDDTMVPDALEILWDTWEGLKKQGNIEKYSGVGVHCMDQQGNRVGSPWPESPMISNDLEMHFKYGITGEKWGPIATRVMKNYKNEEVKGHFLSESTMWYRIARDYQKIYIDKCLRIYEVHEDSESQKVKVKNNNYDYESYVCSSCIYINEFWDWFYRYQRPQAIKMPVALTRRWVENGGKVLFSGDALIHRIQPGFPRLLVIAASPYRMIYGLKRFFKKN